MTRACAHLPLGFHARVSRLELPSLVVGELLKELARFLLRLHTGMSTFAKYSGRLLAWPIQIGGHGPLPSSSARLVLAAGRDGARSPVLPISAGNGTLASNPISVDMHRSVQLVSR